MTDAATPCPGRAYLVGAGPGDPGLLTLRGRECLARADLAIVDALISPALLRHIPPAAERVQIGAGADNLSQEQISRRIVAAARAGKTVVHLKGGDPAIFGRLSEEIEALATAGVPFEVVPGVTTAAAVAAYAGVPLTHPDAASAVALVTAQERQGRAGAPLDFSSLAKFPGTLVVHMGVGGIDAWTAGLLAGGLSPTTPAAVVRRASWSDQTILRSTLGELPAAIRAGRIESPAAIVVGPSAALTPQEWWFTSRPLFGRRVLVARPRHQADALADLLAERGADVLAQPAIEILPPSDWRPLDAALDRLAEFDWIVFSSANGVTFFLERLLARGGDLRRLGRTQLAAIGPGTAEELARYRLRPDRVPTEFRAEALAATLAPEALGKRFLLVRASRGREVLADELTAAGGRVEQAVAYRSEDVAAPAPEVVAALEAGRMDWIAVTSSAIARSLHRMFGPRLTKTRLASISPITSGVLRELGCEPAAEAVSYTMRGLVEAIVTSTARPG